jgi:hypothetical protein
MARPGHSTPRACLIYQHGTEQRDRQIAAGIDAILEAANESNRAHDGEILVTSNHRARCRPGRLQAPPEEGA